MSEIIESEGRLALRCWLDSTGTQQKDLAARVAEWGTRYAVGELTNFVKAQVNHLCCGRRSPTNAQAVALWHITQIEPGAWLRPPK